MTIYHRDNSFIPCDQWPESAPTRTPQLFNTGNVPPNGWPELGWLADNAVYCRYSVDIYPAAGGQEWARATANCDIDGDGEFANWWIDLDPDGVSTTSQHMVPRMSPATAATNEY